MINDTESTPLDARESPLSLQSEATTESRATAHSPLLNSMIMPPPSPPFFISTPSRKSSNNSLLRKVSTASKRASPRRSPLCDSNNALMFPHSETTSNVYTLNSSSECILQPLHESIKKNGASRLRRHDTDPNMKLKQKRKFAKNIEIVINNYELFNSTGNLKSSQTNNISNSSNNVSTIHKSATTPTTPLNTNYDEFLKVPRHRTDGSPSITSIQSSDPESCLDSFYYQGNNDDDEDECSLIGWFRPFFI